LEIIDETGMAEVREKNGESVDFCLDLTVTDDKMKVLLSCDPALVANEDAVDTILSKLKAHDINGKPSLNELAAALDEAKKKGEGLTDFPVVQGRPPVMPVDGKLEWTGDYFKEGYYVDPITKRIDFRQKAGDPSVDEGQLLVKVTLPRPGRDGQDVYGKMLTVPKPKGIFLKAGRNIVWDDKALGYRAKCSGRARRRGRTLDVDPVYRVKGVSNESGNIRHTGQVIVDGDIETDFKVEATGDIEVKGLVYACNITCGRNLTAKEGINGNIGRKISVEGDIFAKYIMNANIESGGNILANREIFQCNIKTRGQVNCYEGRIIGGEISATGGITAGEVGSRGNIRTLLIVGIDSDLQTKIKANTDEIIRWKEVIKKLENGFRKFKANIRFLNEVQKKRMAEVQQKIKDSEEEVSRLESENKEFYSQIRQNCRSLIKIRNMVYPGVILRICDAHRVVDQPLAGPIYAQLDRISGEIALSSEAPDEEAENKSEQTGAGGKP
jgi:uncharacterized protein (DUF342 family)